MKSVVPTQMEGRTHCDPDKTAVALLLLWQLFQQVKATLEVSQQITVQHPTKHPNQVFLWRHLLFSTNTRVQTRCGSGFFNLAPPGGHIELQQAMLCRAFLRMVEMEKQV